MTGAGLHPPRSWSTAGLVAEALAFGRAGGARCPSAVAAALKIRLLDFLSAAFETRLGDLPWGTQALATVRPVAPGQGAADVIGTSLAVTPGDAAFVNAVLGHGLLREDMHVGSIGHHGIVLWPVLMALAQRSRATGTDFLAAAAVAYQGAGRIGGVLIDEGMARLFRPTAVVAPLGGALGAARLLGLAQDAASSAFSIAANTASGFNQWPRHGGGEMYLQPAFAARNVIAAVELAEAGAFASPDMLEGEAGLFAALKRCPAPDGLTLFSDGRFEALEVFSKPAPACNFAQTACQLAYRLAESVGPRIPDIASVTVRLPRAALRYPGCDSSGPFQRTLQAKMSIAFGVAAALRFGSLGEGNYRELDDPGIRRLVERTRLEESPVLTAAYPERQGAEILVGFTDGSTVRQVQDELVPADDACVLARFREAAAACLGIPAARRIEAFVEGLEDQEDAGDLARLCRVEA